MKKYTAAKYVGAGIIAIVASLFTPDPWFVAPYVTGVGLIMIAMYKRWW